MSMRSALRGIYRGETHVNIVGRPRRWYALSAALIILSIIGLSVRWLNFGVEFTGGSVFQFKAQHATVQDVRTTVEGAGATEVTVQTTNDSGWRVTTESLTPQGALKIEGAVAQKYGIAEKSVSADVIGPSWGGQISNKALESLIVFFILIVIYLSVAFEWRMALAAIVALVHDLVITTGVYAWSGFEVSPATVLGFLTILGYSLYDAVVVFDMIKEETRDLGKSKMVTYSQAANDALNHTLVRSLNTSLVALLPVASILFIGTWVFGAGTLKDLSLALFVGILVGTYSSICVATPLLVQLKEREPKFRQLSARLAKRDASAKRQAKVAAKTGASGGPESAADEAQDDDEGPEDTAATPSAKPRIVVQQGQRLQPKRGTRRERGK